MNSKPKPTSIEMCSPDVLAASTENPCKTGLNGPGLPSLTSSSLGPRAGRKSKSSMRLMARDIAIIELIAHYRALRADHVRVALFSPGAASRAQRRLTLLVRNHYLDRLPRQNVNEPAIYLLSRRSYMGNRIIRAKFGDEMFRRHMTKLGSLPHLLAVNDVRVRVERGCHDLGLNLRQWRTADELALHMPEKNLVPDGYFTVERNGQVMRFFLELERAQKSLQAVGGKLSRYADFSRRTADGHNDSLLVLFVFDESLHPNSRRVEATQREAERMGLFFPRLVDLQRLQALSAADCLTRPIWLAPGYDSPITLIEARA